MPIVAFIDPVFVFEPGGVIFTTGVDNTSTSITHYPAQLKKASNHHANLPLEMYSFTL